MSSAQQNGYSAQVDLYLNIDGVRYPVSKAGGNSLFLSKACKLPDQRDQVMLVIEVDGSKREMPIVILGQDEDEQLVRYM